MNEQIIELLKKSIHQNQELINAVEELADSISNMTKAYDEKGQGWDDDFDSIKDLDNE